MSRLHAFLLCKTAEIKSWLRASSRRGRLEAEMQAELEAHLECLAEDLVRSGQTAAEAARRARIALGPVVTHKAAMRASLGLRMGDELGSDLRYGVRILRKSPGFTLIAAASLALAIGANTTIFAVAKQLLFDRLNVPHPEELRMLHWHGDTFDIPPGATRLASTPNCANQWFRLPRQVGFQFHPEIDEQTISEWVRLDAEYVTLANGPEGQARVLADTRRFIKQHHRVGDRLLENIVAEITR